MSVSPATDWLARQMKITKRPKIPPINRNMGSLISPEGESDRGTGRCKRSGLSLCLSCSAGHFSFRISWVVLFAVLLSSRAIRP